MARGRATDFWERYPEDVGLAKRLGCRCLPLLDRLGAGRADARASSPRRRWTTTGASSTRSARPAWSRS